MEYLNVSPFLNYEMYHFSNYTTNDTLLLLNKWHITYNPIQINGFWYQEDFFQINSYFIMIREKSYKSGWMDMIGESMGSMTTIIHGHKRMKIDETPTI